MDKVKHLCSQIDKIEWSGVLFYDVEGTFGEADFKCKCIDVYPMDCGSTGYTEYDYTPESGIIAYMMENPALLDAKKGHIHSHHNMNTFFSGTDTDELHSNSANHNYYLSLIVNNKGPYAAKIAYRGKEEGGVNYNISYRGSDGNMVVKNIRSDVNREVIFVNPCKIYFEQSDVPDTFKVRVDKIISDRAAKIAAYKPANVYSTSPWVKPGKGTVMSSQQKRIMFPPTNLSTMSPPSGAIDGDFSKEEVHSFATKLLSVDALVESDIKTVLAGLDKLTKAEFYSQTTSLKEYAFKLYEMLFADDIDFQHFTDLLLEVNGLIMEYEDDYHWVDSLAEEIEDIETLMEMAGPKELFFNQDTGEEEPFIRVGPPNSDDEEWEPYGT